MVRAHQKAERTLLAVLLYRVAERAPIISVSIVSTAVYGLVIWCQPAAPWDLLAIMATPVLCFALIFWMIARQERVLARTQRPISTGGVLEGMGWSVGLGIGVGSAVMLAHAVARQIWRSLAALPGWAQAALALSAIPVAGGILLRSTRRRDLPKFYEDPIDEVRVPNPRQIRLAEMVLAVLGYTAIALFFRWRGFDWWWYWGAHTTWEILRSDYGPLGS